MDSVESASSDVLKNFGGWLYIEFRKSDGKVISIRLGSFDLFVAVEVEEIEIVDVGANLDGFGGSLIALVGTGLGSPILLKGNKSVKYLTGEGR